MKPPQHAPWHYFVPALILAVWVSWFYYTGILWYPTPLALLFAGWLIARGFEARAVRSETPAEPWATESA